jgi:hypothetical protein
VDPRGREGSQIGDGMRHHGEVRSVGHGMVGREVRQIRSVALGFVDGLESKHKKYLKYKSVF